MIAVLSNSRILRRMYSYCRQVKSNFFNLTWMNLRSFLEVKVIKSTYIWLIITPITAKFFSKVEAINIFDHVFVLELPFSWIYLFFAAFFFTLAEVVYKLKCPQIIQEYSSYIERKKSLLDLHFNLPILITDKRNMVRLLCSTLTDKYSYEKLIPIINPEEPKGIVNLKNEEDTYIHLSMASEQSLDTFIKSREYSEVLSAIVMLVEKDNSQSIRATSICLALGILLTTAILIGNFGYVINYLINH